MFSAGRPRRIKLKSLDHALVYYKSRHRSKGCIITHLFGVPMLVLAPILLLFGYKKTATVLFGQGLILQWLGHAAFEKNDPTLVETRDPLMIPAALIFVTEEWTNVLTGKGITETVRKPIPATIHQLNIEEESMYS